MRAKQLETLRLRLLSVPPRAGLWRRRRAIGALAKDASADAARLLAEHVAIGTDESLRGLTLAALRGTSQEAAIDSICAVWASGRNSVLGDLLVERAWVASSPAPVRVLTALHAQRPDLILEGGAEVVPPLTEACSDADARIARLARECLSQLRHPTAIDALCMRWAEKRESCVSEALDRASYVAQQPISARVLTALRADKAGAVTGGGPEIIEALIGASKDPEPKISRRALSALRRLTDLRAQEALCHVVIDRDEPVAREAAVDAQYAPRDPRQRAVFYFLTEQWPAYESLDFDRRLLGGAYESGDKKLRGRIAEKGRRSGRTEWLTALIGNKRDRRLDQLTDEEWDAAAAVLRENRRWDDLWQLAQAASADWSARLLDHLRDSSWQPDSEQERSALSDLMGLVEHCREEPPFLGRLMHSVAPLTAHTEAVSCVVVSHNGMTLASASQDRTVRLWQLSDRTAHATLEGHTDWVDCLALSPNEQLLASGSRDKTVRVWSWPEGKPLHRLAGHEDELRCLAFSPDGGLLATGSSDASIRLWHAAEGRECAKLNGHSDIVSCLALSADGRWLASGSYDNDVRLWSLPDGELVATLKGHKALINHVAFNPDGMRLVSGSKDRSVIIWNLPDRMRFKRLKGHRDDVSCLAIDPAGEFLATGSWDTTIRLWRLSDGELVDTLGAADVNDGHFGWVSCLAFSPDGKVLASGGFDHTVRLWSVPGGAPLKTLEGHTDRITCVRFSPDGRTLISGGGDKTIRLWRSELARLRRLPISQTTLQDLEWVESALPNSRLSDAERGWMQLILALMRNRRRYDIQLAEATRISVGEFDIELEG